MPPKKCAVAIVNFATKTITIDGHETRCHAHVVTLESSSQITLCKQATTQVGMVKREAIIHEFRAFEEEMQPYVSYGIDLAQFYQTILHADTIRKVTLTRAFPGVAHEPGIVERIVQIMFSNQLVTAYRGGYRKTVKCMERLQRLHDPNNAPVGSHTQYMERARKAERQWMSTREFEATIHAIVTNTALTDREVELELRKLRATAIQKQATKEQLATLENEIKVYTTQQSEVEHVKQQAKDIHAKSKRKDAHKQQPKARVAKPSAKDIYIDETGT